MNEHMAVTVPDIYFDPAFSALYDAIEQGRTEIFTHDCAWGTVRHTFILREIPQSVDGVQYYDAITAYGYGGPMILRLAEETQSCREALVAAFGEAYGAYCRAHNIVSEFVRFHPLYGNGETFKEVFQVQYQRQTVGTDLKRYPDFMMEEYSGRCRKNIRQALRKGVTYEVIEAPEDLKAFETVYYATMDRNEAADYYYFKDRYFEDCLQHYRKNLVLVQAMFAGETIAAGLYFTWGKTVHVHLSGTLTPYLYLSPAYVLRYAITEWAAGHGYELIHHGGGRSNDPEDSLFRFKKQFGEHTEFPFYVGKKIWNTEIYSKLTGGKTDTEGFFPAYRER